MLTSVLLLVSLVTGGSDTGLRVTAMRSIPTAMAGSALGTPTNKKRQRRSRPQRSGMPWETEDDAPDSFKGTFGSSLLTLKTQPTAHPHAIRPACLATAGTPLHLVLHILLI